METWTKSNHWKQLHNTHVRPNDLIQCEHRKQGTVTRHSTQIQKGKSDICKLMLIEVSVPSDFGLNDAEIKKMTKYQDLKNEVKRSWKLKRSEIVPVIIGATGMMKKNLTKILQPITGDITTNELQLEVVRGSVTILRRAPGTKLWEQETFWNPNYGDNKQPHTHTHARTHARTHTHTHTHTHQIITLLQGVIKAGLSQGENVNSTVSVCFLFLSFLCKRWGSQHPQASAIRQDSQLMNGPSEMTTYLQCAMSNVMQWWYNVLWAKQRQSKKKVDNIFFVYQVEARVRANKQKHNKAGDERGRRGKHKIVGNRDMRRSVEGRGMRRGTWGEQDGHYRDFQEEKQGIWRGSVWGGLTGV